MNTRVPEWSIEINHCTAQFFDIVRDLFMTNELHIAQKIEMNQEEIQGSLKNLD